MGGFFGGGGGSGIRWWSPTQLLICRSEACVWQSGRDAQFSSVYGRMWLKRLASRGNWRRRARDVCAPKSPLSNLWLLPCHIPRCSGSRCAADVQRDPSSPAMRLHSPRAGAASFSLCFCSFPCAREDGVLCVARTLAGMYDEASSQSL
ncbi:unnamed protein product [Diplocarpon coronariae]